MHSSISSSCYVGLTSGFVYFLLRRSKRHGGHGHPWFIALFWEKVWIPSGFVVETGGGGGAAVADSADWP